MSLGGPKIDYYDIVMEEVSKKGLTAIVAAGNEN